MSAVAVAEEGPLAAAARKGLRALLTSSNKQGRPHPRVAST